MIGIICAILFGSGLILAYLVLRKNLHIWLPSYCLQVIKTSFRASKRNHSGQTHIYFCFVDHFEPKWEKPSAETENARVTVWCERYPNLATKHRDSEGRYPKHTFFYPEEEYEKEYLDKLADLCKRGFGDVEIHLHHQNDTPENLKEKLLDFKTKLFHEHGLLRKGDNEGEIFFGFIHGMWALDNSRDDGGWCGVNNELQILREAGCYADFTLPSAPCSAQTKKINSIYYATDDPDKPKSHNTGIDVEKGRKASGDLMIIQGPLSLNWRRRKLGILPRIENGEISYGNPPTKDRVDLWVKTAICVKGDNSRVFIKVHAHGCQEKDFDVLLGKPVDEMFSYLERKYNDGARYVLHYVSAWEMYQIIKEIEIDGRDK